ncbi:MAG: hypothetical protein N2Z79_03490 [Candidatus Omnitrophica bacterium]|nr:hypothetical protein [Candidatus Omnitrophota bacterium]
MKFKKKSQILFWEGIIILFYGIVFAQELSFRIEPSTLKLSIPAGKTYSGTVRVYNQKNHPLNIKVYLEDFKYTQAQDGSKDFFPKGTTPFSCAEGLSFSPSKLFIPALGTNQISYTIKVPSEAEGARFGVLFFEVPLEETSSQIPSLETMSSTVKVNIRLGLLLFIEVKDKILRQAEISNLSIKKEHSNKNLIINLDFKNTGNTYLTSKGSYYIMDKQGFIYARGEFNNLYTFPGDLAKLNATWKEALPKGKYDLVLSIDIGKAQEEANLGRGPVLVKEAELEIDDNGEVLKVGELR